MPATAPAVIVEPRAVEFSVFGIPQSKGSTRSAIVWRTRPDGSRFPVTSTRSSNDRIAPWENDIRAALQLHARGVFFEGPVSVRLEFHMPRPKDAPKRIVLPCKAPDLDKLCRGALDALTGKLYGDDSQVVSLSARKVFAVDQPKAVYRVEEVVTVQTVEEWTRSLPWDGTERREA